MVADVLLDQLRLTMHMLQHVALAQETTLVD